MLISMRLAILILNIELATGRVRPMADTGLLDPPAPDNVDLVRVCCSRLD